MTEIPWRNVEEWLQVPIDTVVLIDDNGVPL